VHYGGNLYNRAVYVIYSYINIDTIFYLCRVYTTAHPAAPTASLCLQDEWEQVLLKCYTSINSSVVSVMIYESGNLNVHQSILWMIQYGNVYCVINNYCFYYENRPIDKSRRGNYIAGTYYIILSTLIWRYQRYILTTIRRW